MANTENKLYKNEPSASIHILEGIDRAEHFVGLNHMAYDLGDFKSAFVLCESAREIYESRVAIEVHHHCRCGTPICRACNGGY